MKKIMKTFFRTLTIVSLILVASCSNKEELTGKTKKGDLKSPCVSNEGGPCSNRINPNFINISSKDLIS